MNAGRIRETIMDAIHSVYNTEGQPELLEKVSSGDFAFLDLGGDSMDATDFCFQVEEALDIEIEMSDLIDFPTFESFAAMLDQRLSAAA